MYPISLSKSASYKLKAHQIRYFLIPVLSLILVHLIAYGRLPFENDYTFPTLGFLIILFIGVCVCESNRFNYLRLNKKIPLCESPIKRGIKQIYSNLIVTTIVFLPLTIVVNLLVSGTIPTTTRLLAYLFIVLLISFSETITFLAWDYYKQTKRPDSFKVGGKKFVKTVSGEIAIHISEVACIHSTNGMVTLVLISGKKVITNYNSLKEVERVFDLSDLFQVNRQLLVRADAIKKILKDQNRKLRLEFIEPISKHVSSANISRYKNSEFMSWLKSIKEH